MKTYSDSIRNALILMTVCLFLGGYASSQAMGANPQPRRTTVAGPGFVQPGDGAARLVVWRIADLGKRCIPREERGPFCATPHKR
jgi:hypothetical protein